MLLWKAVSLVGLALCARGHEHATSEQKLKQNFHFEHHGELDHIGAHKPEHHEEYAWAYPSYEFSYQVNDPHTHDHKGQQESRHGDEVKGEYWLVQPDGKKRTVQYHSDKHTGFKAHVHYTDHHDHHEVPHKEEVMIPVEEIIVEEPPKHIEEKEPIIEEVPEIIAQEEPQEELEEQHKEEPEEKHVEMKKHHGPIHIEYYVLHKHPKKHYDEHKEHHEPKEEEVKPEEKHEEPPQQEEEIHEEPQKHHSNKHRKPVHIEYYSKIEHDRGHYIPIVHHKPLLHHEQAEEHHKEVSPVEEVQAERKHYVEHPRHVPLRHKPALSYHEHHDSNHRHQRDYRRKVPAYKKQ